jgi:8-oxo-dGTP pyrophosphatase MutT (NUDIX family)
MMERHATQPVDSQVFAISGIDMRVEPGRHSFEIAEEAAIAENWQRELAANPALYNGEIVLQEEIKLHGGVVEARARMSNFATLLWWRKQPQPTSGRMLVASAVPISSDGAAIVIRMAPHTANPGMVYFAAGSLDGSDLRPDGTVDVLGSMGRELREETGLDVEDAQADPVLRAVSIGTWFYVFRFYRFPWTATEICRRVEAHMGVDPDPEIDAVYPIVTADLALHRYNRLTRVILPFFFGDETNKAG